MVQRVVLIGLMIALFSASGVAQQSATKKVVKEAATEEKASLTTLKGYVVDAMCAKAMVGKENGMKRAAAHTKTCALEEACSAAGYGVMADGKWYKFDANGDERAKAMISASAREKELSFEVTGRKVNDQFVVTSLKEVTLPAYKKQMSTEEHRHERPHE